MNIEFLVKRFKVNSRNRRSPKNRLKGQPKKLSSGLLGLRNSNFDNSNFKSPPNI